MVESERIKMVWYLLGVEAGHLVVAFLGKNDGENRVRSGRGLVHVGGSYRPEKKNDTRESPALDTSLAFQILV